MNRTESPTDLKVEKNTDHLSVRKETKASIKKILDELNSQRVGRAVSADDLVSAGISLLTPTDIKRIQDATISYEDRLKLKYKRYVEKHGPATMSEFLEKTFGKALEGED